MVAFYMPDKGFSLDEDYLVPRGLGWSTINGNVIRVDQDIDEEQIAALEAEGFKRADTNWYSIEPEPERSQHSALCAAWAPQNPSTTIPPNDGMPLKVSFVKALSAVQLQDIKKLGFEMKTCEPA